MQASGFWASGRLKSSIFQNFKLRAGSGRAKFALVRQSVGIYVLTGTNLGIEPVRAHKLRGPKLGLDTSLV